MFNFQHSTCFLQWYGVQNADTLVKTCSLKHGALVCSLTDQAVSTISVGRVLVSTSNKIVLSVIY